MDKDSITAQSLRRGTIIGILSVILGKSFPDKYMLILASGCFVFFAGALICSVRKKNYKVSFILLNMTLIFVCAIINQVLEKYNLLNNSYEKYVRYMTIFSIFSTLVSGGIYHYKQGGPGRAYVKNCCKIFGVLFTNIIILSILLYLGYE